jgi:hypothetical protein
MGKGYSSRILQSILLKRLSGILSTENLDKINSERISWFFKRVVLSNNGLGE